MRPSKISDFAFKPGEVTIVAGQTVTWQNSSATQHTVTADDGSFNSDPLGINDQFANVFSAPGTFAYHCAIHPRMTGTVVVTAAKPTATPNGTPPPTPPSGTLPPDFNTPVPIPTAVPTARNDNAHGVSNGYARRRGHGHARRAARHRPGRHAAPWRRGLGGWRALDNAPWFGGSADRRRCCCRADRPTTPPSRPLTLPGTPRRGCGRKSRAARHPLRIGATSMKRARRPVADGLVACAWTS